MRDLTCFIVDDEPLAVRMLENYVERTPGIRCTASFTDPQEALDALDREPVDLLFLDIQMPELDGLELSRSVPAATRVIFTTAFKEYAFDSYEVNAIDFLSNLPARYNAAQASAICCANEAAEAVRDCIQVEERARARRADPLRVSAEKYLELRERSHRAKLAEIWTREDALRELLAYYVGLYQAERDGFLQNGPENPLRHLLEACRRLGVGAFIYTSTPSVIYRPATDFAYVDETTPYPSFYDCAYAQTKALAEQEVLAANSPQVRTVALRPHLIYGPDDPHLVPRVVERAYAGQLFQVGEGRNLVDLTYVDNAAQAHIHRAEQHGLRHDAHVLIKALGVADAA